MDTKEMKRLLAVNVSTAMLAATMSAGTAYAQDNDDSADNDEIITIGTRRTQRSRR